MIELPEAVRGLVNHLLNPDDIVRYWKENINKFQIERKIEEGFCRNMENGIYTLMLKE